MSMNSERQIVRKLDLFPHYPSILFSFFYLLFVLYLLKVSFEYQSDIMFDLTPVLLTLGALVILSFQIPGWVNFVKFFRKEKNLVIMIEPGHRVTVRGQLIERKEIKTIMHFKHIIRRRGAAFDLEYVAIMLNAKKALPIVISELIVSPSELIELLDINDKCVVSEKRFYHFV